VGTVRDHCNRVQGGDDDARRGEPTDLESERRVSAPVADHEADRGSDESRAAPWRCPGGEREERFRATMPERILQVRVTGVRH
jgi:hypothetical protein